MNAESGNDEEEKNADVSERARKLDQFHRITEDIVRHQVRALAEAVVDDDAHRCDTA
jgi:hypothetical protein